MIDVNAMDLILTQLTCLRAAVKRQVDASAADMERLDGVQLQTDAGLKVVDVDMRMRRALAAVDLTHAKLAAAAFAAKLGEAGEEGGTHKGRPYSLIERMKGKKWTPAIADEFEPLVMTQKSKQRKQDMSIALSLFEVTDNSEWNWIAATSEDEARSLTQLDDCEEDPVTVNAMSSEDAKKIMVQEDEDADPVITLWEAFNRRVDNIGAPGIVSTTLF